jgi:hypothetical protein
VTDSKGNTYYLANYTKWTATGKMFTYYASGITGGASHTITITLSAWPGNDFWGSAAEYSGVAFSTPFDTFSAATGSAAGAIYSGSNTTTQASELIYGYGITLGSHTVDSPYTIRYNGGSGDFMADQTASSIGSYNVTGTTNGGFWGLQMITFKGRY